MKTANWLAGASAVPLGALFIFWFEPASDNLMGIAIVIVFFCAAMGHDIRGGRVACERKGDGEKELTDPKC